MLLPRSRLSLLQGAPPFPGTQRSLCTPGVWTKGMVPAWAAWGSNLDTCLVSVLC